MDNIASKDPNGVAEDDILQSLDKELDSRLSRLQVQWSQKSSHHKQMGTGHVLRAEPSVRPKYVPLNDCTSDDDKVHGQEAGDTYCREGDLHTGDRSERTIVGHEKHSSSDDGKECNGAPERSKDTVAEKCVPRDDAECYDDKEDEIFDEFLDQSTRLRIHTLTKRVTTLSDALKLLQEECRDLSRAKRDACAAVNATEVEKRALNKQVMSLQQDVGKYQKTNKQLQDRVKELAFENQALQKELSSSKHTQLEQRNAQSSSRVQLMRARADNAALKEQLATLKSRQKEETTELHGTIATRETKIKDLERQNRNLTALNKKQERLIIVLNEQKNNIAAAKAAACLEDKFLAVITPLQPP